MGWSDYLNGNAVSIAMMQTIARMGRWLRQAMYKSYLKFFRAEGLLASGGWSIEKPHGFYYDPRFLVDIPAELVDLVFPFLKPLKKTVAEMAKTASARPSIKSVVALLEYLGIVLVQDSLVLSRQFPDDPIHQMLSVSSTHPLLCEF